MKLLMPRVKVAVCHERMVKEGVFHKRQSPLPAALTSVVVYPDNPASAAVTGVVPLGVFGVDGTLFGVKAPDLRFHLFVVLILKHVSLQDKRVCIASVR